MVLLTGQCYEKALNKFRNWEMMFPPRLPLHWHPLIKFNHWVPGYSGSGVVTSTTVGLAMIATNAKQASDSTVTITEYVLISRRGRGSKNKGRGRA